MEILKRCIFIILFILPTFLYAGDIININTADIEVLMSIKGIGEKRAQAIIDYREQNGPFKTIDQLIEIKGVGQLFVDANRDSLVVKENK